MLDARNLQTFTLFSGRAYDRAQILNRIAELSTDGLQLINERFSEKERTKIEKQLIKKHLGGVSKDQLPAYESQIRKSFPHFTDADIESIF